MAGHRMLAGLAAVAMAMAVGGESGPGGAHGAEAAKAVAPAAGRPDDEVFWTGADVSLLAAIESHGGVYRDGGQPRDLLKLLKSRGCNCVRLRVWTRTPDPGKVPLYNRLTDLEYTLPLAQRVKRAGFTFLLDFHYSDTWADPSHQKKPAAWADLPFDALKQRMHDYSRDVVAALKANGAMPDIVQVGNEILGGFLWPDGRIGGKNDTPEQWARFGDLLKSAIAGIRTGAGPTPPKIMIHIDRGGSWSATRWFFDGLERQDVPFDLIGLSFYSWWHGSLAQLRENLAQTARRYRKGIVVVETAYPWTDATAGGKLAFAVSPQGQREFTASVIDAVRQTPDGLGLGVIWWGAEYIPAKGLPTGAWESRSLFDRSGNALPALDVLGDHARPRGNRPQQTSDR